ncbi:hypothetical protein [Rhodococcus kronopolitis]|uniref:Secreted protein n=1 Tax=Rhodococcus kronopolitis TaxID=1460226 RepID=A0ABV9FTP2_9NOCA
MNKNSLRLALAAIAVAPLIALGSGASAGAAAPVPLPPAAQPVVLLGQIDPLGSILACAPWGLIPLFGPNIIFPICVV